MVDGVGPDGVVKYSAASQNSKQLQIEVFIVEQVMDVRKLKDFVIKDILSFDEGQDIILGSLRQNFV